jgi:hypothetical protein
MAPLPNFSDFCEAACITLWGEPDKRDRKQLRWEGHDAYSAKTFTVRKKAWYDHGEQRGGSTLDLVDYAKGQPKRKLTGKAFIGVWAEAHAMGLVPDPPPKPNGGGGPIVATYPYHDEIGALLFEVVRFDTPNSEDRFRQRRPDGAGGFIWDVKGVRTHVLYRLPALIEAVKAGRRVLVTEGERDANTAVALGFAATTNPGGANKWCAEYDRFFRDADVVVVSDNDPQSTDPKTGLPQFHPNGRPAHVGQDHAEKVAKRLRKVAHVRTIMFDEKDLTAWKEAGGTRAALEARIEAAPDLATQQALEPDDGEVDRPTIELLVGRTEQAVDKLEKLLIASDRGLYQRGGLIVSTGFAKMQTFDGKTIVGQVIEDRGDYALIEDAEAVAKFVRFDAEGKAKPSPAPIWLIRTLKDRKHRLKLPILVALVNCPSISAEGRLLHEPGFDPKTGILFDPLGVSFPRVPDRPSEADAVTALARILELLQTFEFVTPDDKAVASSLIISAVCRRGLDFVPMHGFDAPVAGSGKSMLVDLASIIATGHEAGVVAQGESREEAEKRLSAILMRGDPLVAIDNCELPLEGVVLNQALTQHSLDLRILGYSKMVRTQAKALITATGNNLIVKGDVTRRSLVGRLDPKCERPELREFEYDPIADAKEHRAELVVAVLTVLRAYHVAGRPRRPKPPLQSFVSWSDTVRGALVWLGQGDPVNTMARLRETDPALASLKTVLTVWRDDFAENPTTLSDAVAAANATIAMPEPGGVGHVRSYTHPSLREALLVVGGRGGVIDTRVLGQWFAKHQDRVVNLGDAKNQYFAAFEKSGVLHGLQQWRVRPSSPSREANAG